MRITALGRNVMKLLFIREWRHSQKRIAMRIIAETGLILFIYILYTLKKNIFFEGFSYILALPKELYSFLGLVDGVETGNLTFYMKYLLMLFNIWLVWDWSKFAMQNIWDEENLGTIYNICNQICSRLQLTICKTIWPILMLVGNAIIVYSFCALLLLTMNAPTNIKLLYCGSIMGMLFRSLPIMILLLGICIAKSLATTASSTENWLTAVVFGTIVFGNIYKVKNLIVWILHTAEIDASILQDNFNWLEYGYWLSPLSWINPFTESSSSIQLFQIIICILLSAGMLSLGGYLYKRRDF